MFSSKITKYFIVLGVIAASTYFASNYRGTLETKDDYEMVKKYLLNDSPLYGYNRPKLWIHTKYELNSRKWKSFHSRTSTDLNQPYIHLCIKTIINHCGDDFNICLIDDDSFSKLIPNWDIDLAKVAEPMRSQLREIGLLKLVYYFGGMVVPNSFVCLKNLKGLYDLKMTTKTPFFCENVNRSVNIAKGTSTRQFVPDLTLFGCEKNSETVKEIIEILKKEVDTHFTNEGEFLGNVSHLLMDMAELNKINVLGGELIGVKTATKKQVTVDNLLEERFIQFHPMIYGIYIPEDEILKRTKYQWFAVMSGEELLQKKMIISKYISASIVDSSDEYYKSTEKRSVVSL
jgi:hypothetical protein